MPTNLTKQSLCVHNNTTFFNPTREKVTCSVNAATVAPTLEEPSTSSQLNLNDGSIKLHIHYYRRRNENVRLSESFLEREHIVKDSVRDNANFWEAFHAKTSILEVKSKTPDLFEKPHLLHFPSEFPYKDGLVSNFSHLHKRMLISYASYSQSVHAV